MAAILLEGKVLADRIKSSLRAEVEALKAAGCPAPRLVAVQIGEHPSSAVYTRAQQKAADALGIAYELRSLPDTGGERAAVSLMRDLRHDPSVSAVILQMPVPRGIDARKLSALIAPEKDAEGMHPCNLGRILLGDYRIGPCTAMAAMELLAATGEKLYGKEAVVVGHSEIVGKPLALLLLSAFATTTVCHIATGERGRLEEHVRRAEVLIVAVGKPGVVQGGWVRPGAVVIDIGINKAGERIVGDVEFEPARERASFITPVPGGIGPLTTTILMRNVIELCKASARSGHDAL